MLEPCALKTRRCLSPTQEQMPRESGEHLGEGSGLKPGKEKKPGVGLSQSPNSSRQRAQPLQAQRKEPE